MSRPRELSLEAISRAFDNRYPFGFEGREESGDDYLPGSGSGKATCLAWRGSISSSVGAAKMPLRGVTQPGTTDEMAIAVRNGSESREFRSPDRSVNVLSFTMVRPPTSACADAQQRESS